MCSTFSLTHKLGNIGIKGITEKLIQHRKVTSRGINVAISGFQFTVIPSHLLNYLVVESS